MPAIVTNKFRIHNAKSFREGFNEDFGYTTFANTTDGDTYLETNMYLFIGKVTPWSSADAAGADDTNPPNPVDNVAATEYEHWRDMIASKKITHGWVSHVIPRHNWKSGNTYYSYTQTETDLFNQAFYVVTDEYNVYKCLANNASGFGSGAVSTKPTHLSGTQTYTDDYTWKFMFQINAADALKYVTPNYIPVKRVRNANNVLIDDGSLQYHAELDAVDGKIDIINKTSNGQYYIFSSGDLREYQDHTTTSIFLSDDALDTTDIYNNCAVFFTEGDVINQSSVITDYVGGASREATISPALTVAPANGTAYIIGPQVVVEGDGNGARVAAIGNNSHQVTQLQVVDGGSGYSTANVSFVDITHPNAGPFPQETTSGAEASVVIGPQGGHGNDPVEELGGYYVMINTRLEYDESLNFTVNNDFRKIGLLVDPLLPDGTKSTLDLADQAVTITINTAAQSWNGLQFNEDDLLIGEDSGMSGRVIDFMGGNTTIRLIDVVYGTNTTAGYDGLSGSLQIGEKVLVNGGAEAYINTASDSVIGGDHKKFSGNILYVENRSPITRASDQIEDIKLVIEF